MLALAVTVEVVLSLEAYDMIFTIDHFTKKRPIVGVDFLVAAKVFREVESFLTLTTHVSFRAMVASVMIQIGLPVVHLVAVRTHE